MIFSTYLTPTVIWVYCRAGIFLHCSTFCDSAVPMNRTDKHPLHRFYIDQKEWKHTVIYIVIVYNWYFLRTMTPNYCLTEIIALYGFDKSRMFCASESIILYWCCMKCQRTLRCFIKIVKRCVFRFIKVVFEHYKWNKLRWPCEWENGNENFNFYLRLVLKCNIF